MAAVRQKIHLARCAVLPSHLYITIATEASTGVTWPGLVFREISDQGAPARLDFSLYWRQENENPALKRFFKLLQERYPTFSPD